MTDMRTTIASAVALAVGEFIGTEEIRQTETTSGCPVVELTIAGAIYNLTVTKSRKKP